LEEIEIRAFLLVTKSRISLVGDLVIAKQNKVVFLCDRKTALKLPKINIFLKFLHYVIELVGGN
jgi:hypothetical protein